jgi:hypothetical protein
MANALALLVGLTRVNPDCYPMGWDGVNGAWGCELDVDNIHSILSPLGYQSKTLKTENATAENVLMSLREIIVKLEKGDIFTFYFSGHGGRQPSQDDDEDDGRDETLIVFDRPIIDDELDLLWKMAKVGVRCYMISDSCNSGTNYRNSLFSPKASPMSPLAKKAAVGSMQAELIHMGGCRDGNESYGYNYGGEFTIKLCETWNKGAFEGNYINFFNQICEKIVTTQKPQYNEYGSVSAEFRSMKPFIL